MNKRLLALLAITLTLASCGDMTQSADTPLKPGDETSSEVNWEVIDELNLETIKEMYPEEFELYGSQGIVDLGNMACSSVDYGTTVDDIPRISTEYGVEAGLLEAIFSTWIASSCPSNEPVFLNN